MIIAYGYAPFATIDEPLSVHSPKAQASWRLLRAGGGEGTEGGPEAKPPRNAGERLSKALEGSTVRGAGGCGEMQECMQVLVCLSLLTGSVNALEGANGENETNELAQLSTEDSDPAGYAVSAGLGIRPGLS